MSSLQDKYENSCGEGPRFPGSAPRQWAASGAGHGIGHVLVARKRYIA